MPIDFPNSPTNGDTYSAGGKNWQYNGSAWVLQGVVPAIPNGSITATQLASGSVTNAKIGLDVNIVTVCTSSTRPASPFAGQAIFETDTSQFSIWNNSAWIPVGLRPPSAPTSLSAIASSTSVSISFTSGSSPISAISNYEYRISTNGGTTFGSWTALSPADSTSPIVISGLSMGTAYVVQLRAVNEVGVSAASANVSFTTTSTISVEYLVIAGGGGGGGSYGAGGGAGGYRSSAIGETTGGGGAAESVLQVSAGTYAVTVGGGGAGATTVAYGGDGNNSVFGSITSTGGGGGGYSNLNGRTGGSAGGGGGNGGSGGTRTSSPVQGNNGGNSQINSGGGGGGAGAAGNGINGGNGLSSSISGSSVTRGGGGAAGTIGGGDGTAGTGGGGSADTSGTANTGGGGGWYKNVAGGNGGSGVVIVRYLTSAASGLTITGGTATTSGSYTIRTFNSSGSLVVA